MRVRWWHVVVALVVVVVAILGWARRPVGAIKTVEVTKEVTKIVEKQVEKIVQQTVVVEKMVKETVVVEKQIPPAVVTPVPTSIAMQMPARSIVQVQVAQPVTATQAVTASASLVVTATQVVTGTAQITGTIQYPSIVAPDPNRQQVFPDVPFQGRTALCAYETPFEDGDYFETGFGDIDLPQYYYRIITAGKIKIPELGIDCEGSAGKGCAVVLVSHYGPTAMWRRSEVDNGFTVAGQVFDMGSPEKVTLVAQTLVDHVVYRMTVKPNPGANCSTIDGCPSVEWYVVVIGDGKPVALGGGLFRR